MLLIFFVLVDAPRRAVVFFIKHFQHCKFVVVVVVVVFVVVVAVVVVYEMTHCMMAVSLPPVEMRRLSSGRNSTLVT